MDIVCIFADGSGVCTVLKTLAVCITRAFYCILVELIKSLNEILGEGFPEITLLVIRRNLQWHMQYVLAGLHSAIPVMPECRKHGYQMSNSSLQGNFKRATHVCSPGAG